MITGEEGCKQHYLDVLVSIIMCSASYLDEDNNTGGIVQSI